MAKNVRCKKCGKSPHHCECNKGSTVKKCSHQNEEGKCPQCNLANKIAKKEVEKIKKEQEKTKEAAEKKVKEEVEKKAQEAAERIERERLSREVAERERLAEEKRKAQQEKLAKEKNNSSNDNPNSPSGHHCQACNKKLTNLEYKINFTTCKSCENSRKRKNKEGSQETSKRQKAEDNKSTIKSSNQQASLPSKESSKRNGVIIDKAESEGKKNENDEKFRRMNEEVDFINLESIVFHKAKDLSALEKNYQTVKNHPLYTTNKKSFSGTTNGYNNKERLDNTYKSQKKYLQSSENYKNTTQTNQNSKDLEEKLKGKAENNYPNIDKNKIKQYFQENGIYSISLKKDGKLLIKYNSGEKKILTTADNQQLREVGNYLRNQSKQSIRKGELIESDLKAHEPRKPNYLLWISGGGLLAILVGLFIWRTRKGGKKNE